MALRFKHLRSTFFLTLPVLFLLVGGLVGCGTPIGVRKVGADRSYKQINRNILDHDELSVASLKVLQRFDLVERFEDSLEEVLVELKDKACADTRRDLLFALAELSFAEGARSKDKAYYVQSSIYAYLYLFEKELDEGVDPYDRRFRVGLDLYNRALAEALASEDGDEIDLTSRTISLPSGHVGITADRSGFPWEENRFSRFLSADAYRVRGLERHRDSGLGLPLIGVPSVDATGDVAEGKVPPALKVPATVFLRVLGNRCDAARGELSASLELYSVYDVTEIQIGDQTVPLEMDLTTPLAYTLDRSKIWEFELAGFFGRLGSGRRKTSGIFLVQPYQQDKIPVVFVHGTASSPARWANMFNELQADDRIRKNFQVWMFIYPSGNPIAYSASLLRDSLNKVVHALDPNGEDHALSQLIIIGHSQGGLLTKMMVIEPEDRLWSNLTDKKIDEIEMPDKTRELLQKALFFDPLPFVKRVVFISTPQHGSFVSKNWIGRFFSRLVSLPGDIIQIPQSVINAIASDLPPELKRKIPTSVDNMSPDHPFIIQLAKIPIEPDVIAHSIIAVKGNGPVEEGNDGVVEYKSAHIDGVESEFVVRSGHSAQGHPLVIEEVRRILLEHATREAIVSGPEPVAE